MTNKTYSQPRLHYITKINPFPSKGFPFDEQNRLALDRVKSISALSAHSAVKGLRITNLTTRKSSKDSFPQKP